MIVVRVSSLISKRTIHPWEQPIRKSELEVPVDRIGGWNIFSILRDHSESATATWMLNITVAACQWRQSSSHFILLCPQALFVFFVPERTVTQNTFFAPDLPMRITLSSVSRVPNNTNQGIAERQKVNQKNGGRYLYICFEIWFATLIGRTGATLFPCLHVWECCI